MTRADRACPVPSLFRVACWTLAGCLLAACGFGTASVTAALGGGGGGTANAPSTPAGLLVLDTKTAPARIRIVMTDLEADAATVEFRYVLPTEPGVERALRHLAANPVSLSASKSGITHELTWDFAKEDGLPADASFVDGVTLIASVRNGATQSTVTGLGNDAPVVDQIVVPPFEITGIANVSFRVADSSADPVDIEVEFFDQAAPAAGWRPARAAGEAGAPGAPAFQGVIAPRGGTTLTFFWDTYSRDGQGNPVGDLVDLERNVKLRFRARDPVVAQTPEPESAVFRVDNNDVPQVQMDEGLVLTSADRLEGIAIPYRAFDQEGDAVSLVFQWRTRTQPAFPDLGTTDYAQLATLLRDPEFVRAKQICRPFGSPVQGAVVPIGPAQVRLPDLLAGKFADTLAQGVVGRRLELLRPRNGQPVALAGTWATNALQAPVASLSVGNGDRALVLDDRGGSAALLEIELASGTVLRSIATLQGTPTAMARARTDNALLVALDLGGTWQVIEVSLTSGVATLRAEQAVGGIAGPLRGLAARSSQSALATAGSTLLHIDWVSAATVGVLVGGLAEPRGIVLDPRNDQVCYVAERSAGGTGGPGRVARVRLDRQAIEPLPGLGLTSPQPIALALAAHGSLLRVLCQPVGQSARVVDVPLGSAAVASQTLVPAQANSVATGDDGLLLVTVRATPDLVVQGGVEQRRRIVGFAGKSATATVDAPFTPAPRAGQTWRLPSYDPFFDRVVASPTGTSARFVWDSRDATAGEDAFVRAVAIDSEAGLPDSTSGPLRLATRLGRSPTSLPVATGKDGLATGDLDGDGDADFVAALSGGPTILTQGDPGVFTVTATLSTAGQGSSTCVAIGDMNGDGRLDVVTGLASGYGIYMQNAAGAFPGPPVLVGSGIGLPTALQVEVADLDGDGRTDLVFRSMFFVGVFFQTGTMVFDAAPQLLSGIGPPADLTIADFDHDRSLEIVLPEQDMTGAAGFVVVYRQTAPRVYAPSPPRQFPRKTSTVATADLDGDGALDLVVALDHPEGGLSIDLSGPSGATFLRVPNVTTGIQDLVIADTDGDGDLDIVAVNPTNGQVLVINQLSPGSFSPTPLQLGGAGSTDGANGIVAGDFDGDGFVDLAVTGAMKLLTHGASNSLATTATILGGPASTDDPRVLTAGTFSSERRLDLLTTNRVDFSSLLTVFGQTGTGAFAPPQTSNFLAATLLTNLIAYDLDGDGDTDIAWNATSGSTAGTQVMHQVAPAQFLTSQLSPQQDLPAGALQAGDLDGDGDLDLLIQSRIAFQNANGGFDLTSDVLTLGSATAIADFDGDGDFDVVAGNGSQVALHRQTSPGVFQATPTNFAVPGSVQALAVGDLDGDGDIDLAVGTSSSVAVLLQSAPGVFAPAVNVLALGSTSLAIGDLDGDGLADLATCSSSGLIVVRQIAPGAFRRLPVTLGAGPSLNGIVLADFDGDGALDIAIIDPANQRLRVFFGGR